MTDPIVNELHERLDRRQQKGEETYGVSIAAQTRHFDWIDETVDELLDACCYLLRKKQELNEVYGSERPPTH